VIDVGTNSVKLLVGDVEHNLVTPVLEQAEQTRLGSGTYSHLRLQADAIGRTVTAVAAFARQARTEGAASIRIIATSAARDASNRDDLVQAIHRACQLELEILSGDAEADWVYRGVASDPQLAQYPLLIIDVGGGSTECVIGQGAHAENRFSFPLGTVRLLEQVRPPDPPPDTSWQRCQDTLHEEFGERILPALSRVLAGDPPNTRRLVGASGTASILAAMHHQLVQFDRTRIDGTALEYGQVQAVRRQLWSLGLPDRRRLAGLPPERADVMLFGVALYEMFMETLHLSPLRVSTRGLRFAALTVPPTD